MRNRIISAAIEEMMEHGIKFTMTDLATRLAVSKRTIYEYFTSKEDLIDAILFETLEEIHQQRLRIIETGTVNFYEKMAMLQKSFPQIMGRFGIVSQWKILTEIQRYLPEKWARIVQSQNEDWEIMKKFLQQGIHEGYLRPVNLEIVKKILIDATWLIVNEQFLTDNNLTIRNAVEQYNDIVFKGLLTGRL